jgi:hypothetical protein
MTSNRSVLTTQLLAWAAAALSSVGCGSLRTAPHVPVQSAGVDFGGRALPTRCTLAGATRVLATKVAPYVGINAQTDGERVLLSFLQQRGALAVTLAVEPQSLDAVDGAELEGRLVDGRDPLGESLAGEQVAPMLWQPPAPEALDPEHPERAPSDELRAPGTARVDSERWVSVWSAGSMYTGMDVRVQTSDRRGTPIGDPITLATDGRTFGAPAVAIGGSGRGVVAFLQSGDHGFELVATSLDCHVRVLPEMTAGWAMHDHASDDRPSDPILRTTHSSDNRNGSSDR